MIRYDSLKDVPYGTPVMVYRVTKVKQQYWVGTYPLNITVDFKIDQLEVVKDYEEHPHCGSHMDFWKEVGKSIEINDAMYLTEKEAIRATVKSIKEEHKSKIKDAKNLLKFIEQNVKKSKIYKKK